MEPNQLVCLPKVANQLGRLPHWAHDMYCWSGYKRPIYKRPIFKRPTLQKAYCHKAYVSKGLHCQKAYIVKTSISIRPTCQKAYSVKRPIVKRSKFRKAYYFKRPTVSSYYEKGLTLFSSVKCLPFIFKQPFYKFPSKCKMVNVCFFLNNNHSADISVLNNSQHRRH